MGNVESENILEQNLIKKLESFGYEKVVINNEEELIANFRLQIEEFNDIKFTDKEFQSFYNSWLNKGDNFDRASLIRNDVYHLKRDSEIIRIKLFNNKNWCENIFQVTNQITAKGDRTNRYDVTILINGLPMVQIELKRQGIEHKKAFNQINRYKRDSFKDLFKFIQIFIISNGNETKYFSTNELSMEKSVYEFAFTWSDEKNSPINNLLSPKEDKESFAQSFLTKCHLGKMISKYMIVQKSNREMKVLRPYQYHAIEKILKLVEDTNKGGYVWHTTGSGKTLTSFKVAQEIKNSIDKIEKVFFVVDRKDLESQTKGAFNVFDSDEDILDVNNTKTLIKSIKDNKNKLVITTIQKFERALKELNNDKSELVKHAKEKRVVFIFDEAHRSQFGDTNREIRKFYGNNIQMIGFTGTPILAKNAGQDKLTTESIFGEMIHSYTIAQAINDKNVLGFKIEYMKTYEEKEDIKKIVGNEESPPFDKKSVWESPRRIEKIVENIFNIHSNQTRDKKYNAMFVVSSIEMLKKYYLEFKKQNEKIVDKSKKLNVSAIYSIDDNEDVKENSLSSRDFYDNVIRDFTKFSNEKINIGSFNYEHTFRTKLMRSIIDNDNNDVDIVIVVSMLTTGFDSKKLNTLYIDKVLEYHNLIQAFSRTNRVETNEKPYGNIICYSRPSKEKVDESIMEFSDANALSFVIRDSYEIYVDKFNKKLSELISEFGTLDIDKIVSLRYEDDKYKFAKLFKELNIEFNMAKTFFEFNWEDLNCTKQEYLNFKEEYLKIYRSDKNNEDKLNVEDKFDFEIQLIQIDKIDGKYIRDFLNRYKSLEVEENEYRAAVKTFNEDLQRSIYPQKLIDLITDFVNEQLRGLEIENNLVKNVITEEHLNRYIDEYKKLELEKIVESFKLPEEDFYEIIKHYEETEKISYKEIKSILKVNKEKRLQEEINTSLTWWEYARMTGRKIIDSIENLYESIRM